MKVLALDPGERVGWSTGTIDHWLTFPDGVCVREAGLLPEHWLGHRDEGEWKHELRVDAHGISYLKDAALAIEEALVEGRYDVVVMEGFKLTPRGAKTSIGSTMQTVQFIGMVRSACWRHGVKLVMQWPADKSSARRSLKIDNPAAHDINARLAKLPKSHDDSHDGDALIHLWHFFFTEFV